MVQSNVSNKTTKGQEQSVCFMEVFVSMEAEII